jgi:uncharacterized protein
MTTNLAAFSLHQALEQAYSCVLLTLANYGPPSHNIKFLRSLAEEQDRRLVWPRHFPAISIASALVQHAQRSPCEGQVLWHYEISEEALGWGACCSSWSTTYARSILKCLSGIATNPIIRQSTPRTHRLEALRTVDPIVWAALNDTNAAADWFT